MAPPGVKGDLPKFQWVKNYWQRWADGEVTNKDCLPLDSQKRQALAKAGVKLDKPFQIVEIQACHIAKYEALQKIDERLAALGFLPPGVKPWRLDSTPKTQDSRTRPEVPPAELHPLIGARILLPSASDRSWRDGQIVMERSDSQMVDGVKLALPQFRITVSTGGDVTILTPKGAETLPGINGVIEDLRWRDTQEPAQFKGHAMLTSGQMGLDQNLLQIESGLCTLVTQSGEKTSCQEPSKAALAWGHFVDDYLRLTGEIAVAGIGHWLLKKLPFIKKVYVPVVNFVKGFTYRILGIRPNIFIELKTTIVAKWAARLSGLRKIPVLGRPLAWAFRKMAVRLEFSARASVTLSKALWQSGNLRALGWGAIAGHAYDEILGGLGVSQNNVARKYGKWVVVATPLVDAAFFKGRATRFVGKQVAKIGERVVGKALLARAGGWLARRWLARRGLVAGAGKLIPIVGWASLAAELSCEAYFSGYEKDVHARVLAINTEDLFPLFLPIRWIGNFFLGSANAADIAAEYPEITNAVLAEDRKKSLEVLAGLRGWLPQVIASDPEAPSNYFDPTNPDDYARLSFGFLETKQTLELSEVLLVSTILIKQQGGVDLEAVLADYEMTEQQVMDLIWRYEVYNLQQGIAYLHWVDQPVNDWAREAFDQEGRLNEGGKAVLLSRLVPEVVENPYYTVEEHALLQRKLMVTQAFFYGMETIYGKDARAVAQAAGVIDQAGRVLATEALENLMHPMVEAVVRGQEVEIDEALQGNLLTLFVPSYERAKQALADSEKGFAGVLQEVKGDWERRKAELQGELKNIEHTDALEAQCVAKMTLLEGELLAQMNFQTLEDLIHSGMSEAELRSPGNVLADDKTYQTFQEYLKLQLILGLVDSRAMDLLPAEKWQGISDARTTLDERYSKRAAINQKMQVLERLDTDILKVSLSLYHSAANELQAQHKMLANLQSSAEDTSLQVKDINDRVRKQAEVYAGMLDKLGGDEWLLGKLIVRYTPVAKAEAEYGTWRSYLQALGYEGLEEEGKQGDREMRDLLEAFKAASEMPE